MIFNMGEFHNVPKSIKIGISQVFESDAGHLSSVAGKIGFVKLMLFRRLMICFNHRMTIRHRIDKSSPSDDS